MANTKRFTVGWTTGGNAAHVAIQRVSDGNFWSDGIGFVSGAPVLNLMTEAYSGFWVYETDSEIWSNGLYYVAFYDGSVVTQIVISAYPQTISGDTQVGFIEASSITSKNAVTALRGDIQAIQAQAVETNTQLGVLADRIDSMNQVLARRDYKQ